MLRRRRWVAYGLFAVAIVLLPWTGWLTVTLPSRHVSEHWDAAWVGLDVGELIALALTGYALLKRTTWIQGVAASAGTLLVADAWFDTLLTGGDEKFWIALGQAVFSELPLALLCFWIAADTARFYARWERLRIR
jgi:hypothetical protein